MNKFLHSFVRSFVRTLVGDKISPAVEIKLWPLPMRQLAFAFACRHFAERGRLRNDAVYFARSPFRVFTSYRIYELVSS